MSDCKFAFPMCVAVAAACFLSFAAQAAEDPNEVEAVVAAVKAANKDMRVVCQGGPDSIRKAVTEAVMPLVAEGKIKGNPQAVGGEAGQKLGRGCRGG